MANYTTLGNVNLFACYIGTIKKYENIYRNKTDAEKVDFFQQAANFLTASIGIPPVTIKNTTIYKENNPLQPDPRTIALFRSLSGNLIEINNLRIRNTDLQEFHKLAVTFYHELRHAEQLFRGLQYYRQILKRTGEIGVGADIDVFAKDAIKYPLPPDRINFGAIMLDEYRNPKVALDPITKKPILDPKTNLPIPVQYEKEVVERDSFLFSREGYKILGYSQAQATAWYNLAFENIDADVVRGETSNGPTGAVVSRTPLGLVDPTTSYYSTRVKLAKVGDTTTITIDGAPKTFQPIPISELNSISGSSISNNNDTLNGDVIIVAGAIVPSPFKDDLIQGFGGNDVIDGKEGNDFLYGNEGADSIKGGNGNDRLFGGAGNDFLEGGSGNDILDGETGNDTMSGGLGDDSYYMDSVGDIIQGEIITGGRDLVYSSVSLNLGAFLEDLILTGDGSITGAGNGLNNLLVGNNKVNILNGLAGDDILYGLNGNDTLKGGDGNDYLNGDGKFGIADGDGVDGNSTFAVPNPVVLGSDLMEGGKGNDTYVVNIIGDVVVENVAEGIDTVISSISYNLGANLENLTLVGSGNITGAGNTLDNVLTGNDKVNLLNGLAGNDTIYGGGGNDTLTGSTGDDILVGEAGNDSLIGGVGFDRFSFGTPGQAFTTATSGFDTIADFQAGTDKIQLQRSSFTALTTLAGSALKASEFAIVTTDAAAATSAGLVVYNQTNDKLFYNANGTAVGFGSGGEFAMLSNISTLSASNIAVV